MPDFQTDEPAWSIEHKAVVRILKCEKPTQKLVAARYSIELKGGHTISNFPGYNLRRPTDAQLQAVFGSAYKENT